MPVPVLMGLPWLGAAIGALLVTVFGYFAQLFTKRLIIIVAVVAGVATFTAALYVALDSLVGSVSVSAPAELSQAASMFLPGNLTACVTALLSAKIIRWVYDWNVRVLTMQVS